MSKAMEKRIKILPSAEQQASAASSGAPPVRGASDDLGKILAGHTRYRCINEDANVQPCNIIFPQSAYQVVVDHLSEDTSREHGGFLLGHEIYSGDSEVPTVEIIQAVPARHTEGTPTRLTFTEETWRDLDQITERYDELGQKLERVGWYHSHPNISIFLSHYDLDVCTIFDRRRYPIALVVDPIRKRGGFFVRGEHGYAPQSAQGFYEKHDVAKESLVKWTNMARSLQVPVPPPIRTGETTAGAVERPPIRIEMRKSRDKRSGITLGRLAFGMLLFIMAGALGILTYNQQKTEQRLDDLFKKVTELERNPAGPEPKKNTETQYQPPASDASAQKSAPQTQVDQGSSAAPVTQTKVKLSIEPSHGTIKAGEVVQFTLKGPGSGGQHPKWEIQPNYPVWQYGKINAATGEYTPPSTIARSRKVTIIAVLKPLPLRATITLAPSKASSADPGKSASGGDDVTVNTNLQGNKGTASANEKTNLKDGANKPAQPPEQNNSNNSPASSPNSASTHQSAAGQPASNGGNTPTPTPSPSKNAQGANTNSADPAALPKTPSDTDPGPDHKDDRPPQAARAVFAMTSISPQS